ncbi:enoyl-CoA hydratase/isomerase family protein, partial [Acinetobacter baumannii]
SAKFGLPEVKLGILPGAGGTQRMPRVAGVETALEMATKGDPISAEQAKAAGLVDRLATEGNLLADAVAFAQEVIGKPVSRS